MTVFIPPQMRDLTDGESAVELDASSVRELIGALDARFPGIAARLIQGDRLAAGLAVSVDGEISNRGLRTRVQGAREVHFLPALGGG